MPGRDTELRGVRVDGDRVGGVRLELDRVGAGRRHGPHDGQGLVQVAVVVARHLRDDERHRVRTDLATADGDIA